MYTIDITMSCVTFLTSDLLDGASFHVTVPTQPASSLAECVLKVTTPLKINVVSSLNGNAVLAIPYGSIRRFGCQVVIGSDIVWFETCNCGGNMEEFIFFVVASGIEKAYQIVQEYKRSMELALRDHMIMEEGDQSQFLFSYVVKSHYGHLDYPSVGRERILQSGLMSLSTSGGALSLSDHNKFARCSRPSLTPAQTSVDSAPIPGDTGTRLPLSPTRGGTSKTLDQLKASPRPSRSSFQSSAPAEFDSGVGMDMLDPGRHSAPCFFPAINSRPSLADTRTRKSVDESQRLTRSQPAGKMSLSNFNAGRSMDANYGKKMSLAELQMNGSGNTYNNLKGRGSRKDSGMGDMSPSGNGRSSYDHLKGKGNPYDHLPGKVAGMSLHNKSGSAYVDS